METLIPAKEAKEISLKSNERQNGFEHNFNNLVLAINKSAEEGMFEIVANIPNKDVKEKIIILLKEKGYSVNTGRFSNELVSILWK